MTALGITTGCLHPFEALGDAPHRIRALDADGIEFTFFTAAEVTAADPDMLVDLTDTFLFVTVHAPIRDAVTGDEDLSWVQKLEQIRETVGAYHIVFHPPKLPSLDFVTSEATVAIENMQRKKGFDRKDFAAFIDDWDGPLVVDVCHAAIWGMDEIDHLFQQYGDRIGHVHLSAYRSDEHEPVNPAGGPGIRRQRGKDPQSQR